MTAADLSQAKVLVVGLGRSGLAAAELLRRHGAAVFATDVRPLAELPEAAARLEQLRVPFAAQSPEAFAGKDLVVLSPGVPADLDALAEVRRRGVPVIGEVELAGWFLKGPTIGITGSNGKTTTTALTGHILRECGVPVQVGGNIGDPPANMVASSRPDQWNVLELSSFQLETIERFRVEIGVALNVTPDHLDRHHSMEAYTAAKRRIFETQGEDGRAVLNADDEACRCFGEATRTPPVWFSSTRRLEAGLWLEANSVFFNGRRLIAAGEIPLRGRHNVENVMAAAAAAYLAGAPLDEIAAAIRTFPGVEHRLEFVHTLDGVDYFNDSKATNVDATLKAIDAFAGGLWVILGGKDKGSDYTPLREPLRRKAHAALLVGAAAPKIAGQLGDAAELLDCGTIEAAVQAARRRAKPGDTVLLAPACASFDQFTSFEHRGRIFKDIVRKLAAGSSPAREESHCA